MKKDLFINVWDYLDPAYPFSFFVGGRGIGKTYSALSGVLDRKAGFILMRRTDVEREMAELFNPFSQINADKGLHVVSEGLAKNSSAFYHAAQGDDGEWRGEGEPIGYLLALSTLSGMRGLGFKVEDVRYIIFDEFIPEKHKKEIKEEAEAFFNAYETINRNRELLGEDPISCFFLSNSNRLDAPIFKALGLVRVLERMRAQGKNTYKDPKRGIAVYDLKPSAEFLKRKKASAIARLTEGTDFAAMAFGNEFSGDDFSAVAPKRLEGYTPYASVGKCRIWQRKGLREFYCTYSDGSFAYRYNADNDADRMLGRSRHALAMKKAYAEGRISFESYDLKGDFLDFFAIK